MFLGQYSNAQLQFISEKNDSVNCLTIADNPFQYSSQTSTLVQKDFLDKNSQLFANSSGINAIKINMLSPLFKIFAISYERAKRTHLSYQIDVGLLSGEISGRNDGISAINGVWIYGSLRYYYKEEILRKLYNSIYLGPKSFSSKVLNKYNEEANMNYNLLSSGLLLGYQWQGKLILYDVFAGIEYNLSNGIRIKSKMNDYFENGFLDPIFFRVGFSMGLNW
jgi:hypothetical protein